MAYGSAGGVAPAAASVPTHTPLNRQQIVGFWAAWFGWMLDGMDSVIYALVLGPALTELLPRSGYAATPANIGFVGSLTFGLFALFCLIGWIWIFFRVPETKGRSLEDIQQTWETSRSSPARREGLRQPRLSGQARR